MEEGGRGGEGRCDELGCDEVGMGEKGRRERAGSKGVRRDLREAEMPSTMIAKKAWIPRTMRFTMLEVPVGAIAIADV